ncbi:hypothetical protein [Cohnella caldifontis]|uniref:hypothetical protein n=1 Tax=Cohnella caldifontis TaxID=3027471 RepID=UPI0023EC72EA|nr:hypothetical protein [Cohnella sp. YIM B05605]
MIQGLYETHLPVRNLGASIAFYRNFVRPYQGNVSVYFDDPDGNSLEFMCFVEVPEHLRDLNEKISLAEWEKLLSK